jgi:uncharacterized OsmC-like protein
MAEASSKRSVSVERVAPGKFVATNARGGKLLMATGEDAEFTPVELLLAAIGGCTAIDIDILTTRRSEPAGFEVEVSGDKIRDTDGNRLVNIETVFRIAFPEGEAGDAARELLPGAVAKSHDRLCTVGRTIEVGTPIATRID